ncbi:hypothetical protein KBX06_24150 [Micromonospora sp. C31]|uniref:hypothetical protein n=1 Tax=Micromonospora sp. C31 TaxID=2824876 RepID=UPI001B3993C7|nr:hypothetical protein [Micromonospora sp. C31]MBQ1076225.1 hypothetical protein [Micromonospora sp. C31]
MTEHVPIAEAPRCVAPRCGRSGAPRLARPGAQLCLICQERLDGHLAALPRQYHRSMGALTRSPGKGERIRGGGSSYGIPLHFATVDARAAAESVLSCWAQLVVDERDVAAPRRDVSEMARFLRLHQEWLVAHSAAGELSYEIGALYGRFRALLDADEPRRMSLGACPASECSGTISAALRNEEPGGECSDVRCSDDPEHHWPVGSWGVLRQLRQRTRGAA